MNSCQYIMESYLRYILKAGPRLTNHGEMIPNSLCPHHMQQGLIQLGRAVRGLWNDSYQESEIMNSAFA